MSLWGVSCLKTEKVVENKSQYGQNVTCIANCGQKSAFASIILLTIDNKISCGNAFMNRGE